MRAVSFHRTMDGIRPLIFNLSLLSAYGHIWWTRLRDAPSWRLVCRLELPDYPVHTTKRLLHTRFCVVPVCKSIFLATSRSPVLIYIQTRYRRFWWTRLRDAPSWRLVCRLELPDYPVHTTRRLLHTRFCVVPVCKSIFLATSRSPVLIYIQTRYRRFWWTRLRDAPSWRLVCRLELPDYPVHTTRRLLHTRFCVVPVCKSIYLATSRSSILILVPPMYMESIVSYDGTASWNDFIITFNTTFGSRLPTYRYSAYSYFDSLPFTCSVPVLHYRSLHGREIVVTVHRALAVEPQVPPGLPSIIHGDLVTGLDVDLRYQRNDGPSLALHLQKIGVWIAGMCDKPGYRAALFSAHVNSTVVCVPLHQAYCIGCVEGCIQYLLAVVLAHDVATSYRTSREHSQPHSSRPQLQTLLPETVPPLLNADCTRFSFALGILWRLYSTLCCIRLQDKDISLLSAPPC